MEAAAQSRQFSRILLATDVLRSSNSLRMRALGTSMLPSIWPGDILTIRHCLPDHLRVGDIVLVCSGDRLLAHRVVTLKKTEQGPSWITRGDAMPQNDTAAGDFEVLGKVIRIERRAKVIAPEARRSRVNRVLGSAVSRSPFFLNILLRLRQIFRLDLQDEIIDGVSAI